MSRKTFLLSCIAGTVSWIMVALFLILLNNSEEFSTLIGLQAAVGIGLSVYSLFTGKRKKIDTIYCFCFLIYFIFVMMSLMRITSGRVVLTAMTLILSFIIFQKGFTDWREKCC